MPIPSDSAQNAHCVMIIDDDGFSQQVLLNMLGQLGVNRILQAANGREALRILAGVAIAPDYLICDIYMPDMDGIEFITELSRSAYPGKVILVSGVNLETLALAQDIAQDLGLRIAAAFEKPLRLQALAYVMGLDTG